MTMPNPLRLLGGLGPARFLREYWQKKPLLVRGAWPDFTDPLTPDELAGLACEDDVESRLVLEKHGNSPWEVRHGPFSEETFRRLPETHWTLLVQDAEKHLPDLYLLIEPFRFLPDWRIDDLMISYAPLHGSVGPHMDSYDVFLLQGKGKRRWQINCSPDQQHQTLETTELSIIGDFVPQQDWVLEPGDLLYLPPGVAHYGVAQTPCLTYSIGFRAPSHQDLAISLMDFLMQRVPPEARFADPDIGTQDNPGEISTDALSSIKATLHPYLALDDDRIERWFGSYITEPKIQFLAEPCEEPIAAADLRLHLDKGGTLDSNPGSRFAYRRRAQGQIALFVDGEEIAVGPEAAYVVPILCQHRHLSAELMGPVLHDSPVQDLLLTLVNAGYLIIYEDH